MGEEKPGHKERESEQIPWGQRLFDRPIVLLVLGLVTMFCFYTIWGMFEILTLPQGTLP